MTDLNRRSFIFAAASALLLPHLPAEAREATTPNEAWLAWILERLEPGVLIGISGRDKIAIKNLIAEVMRDRGNKLIYVSDTVRTPLDMKRECLRRNLPAICGIAPRFTRYMEVADIVLDLDGDTLTLTKHRWASLNDGPR